MTSNQVAYAQAMVADRAEKEGERHNQAWEEETNRHNLATEQLTKAAQDIEQEKAYWDRWYKQESLAVQKDYNKSYLALQTAQGNRKLDIEADLAAIKNREQLANEQYQQNMVRVNQMANEIKQQLADEEVRANTAREGLTQQQIANETWSNTLKNKQIEYQNSYWNASISLGNLNAVYGRERDLNNYSLGLLNLNLGLNNLKVQAGLTESQKTLNYSQTWKNYINGFTGAIRDIGATLNPYNPLLLFGGK